MPNKGFKHSEESRIKIGLNGFHYGMLGKKHTEKWKQKMKIRMKGNKYSLGKHYIMSEEHRKKISESHFGKKLSSKHRKRISESHKGYIMPESQKRKISIHHKNTIGFGKWMIGKKHTQKTKEKVKRFQDKLVKSGKHHLWKGGITPLVRKIRNSFKYRQWRSDIFTRDNFICTWCGDNQGGNLEAHHIKPFHLIMKENNIKTFKKGKICEELWNINNGITLCINCHNKTKKYGIKKFDS